MPKERRRLTVVALLTLPYSLSCCVFKYYFQVMDQSVRCLIALHRYIICAAVDRDIN